MGWTIQQVKPLFSVPCSTHWTGNHAFSAPTAFRDQEAVCSSHITPTTCEPAWTLRLCGFFSCLETVFKLCFGVYLVVGAAKTYQKIPPKTRAGGMCTPITYPFPDFCPRKKQTPFPVPWQSLRHWHSWPLAGSHGRLVIKAIVYNRTGNEYKVGCFSYVIAFFHMCFLCGVFVHFNMGSCASKSPKYSLVIHGDAWYPSE